MGLTQEIYKELYNHKGKYKVLDENGKVIKDNDKVKTITVELFIFNNNHLLSNYLAYHKDGGIIYLDEEFIDDVIEDCKHFIDMGEGEFLRIAQRLGLDFGECLENVKTILEVFNKLDGLCKDGEDLYYTEY